MTLATSLLEDIHREVQRDANARWVIAIALVVLVAFLVFEKVWDRVQRRKDKGGEQ